MDSNQVSSKAEPAWERLKNGPLIERLKLLALEERQATTQVLSYLCEVEKRMLHLEMGFSSLYDFCIQELGYSEGSAYRRISAMRLLRSLPVELKKETEKKVESGALTLSTLSSVQGFFKAEKKHADKLYSPDEKIRLLETLAGKSKKEVDGMLSGIQPAVLPGDRERQINSEKVEIRFTADNKLIEKIQTLKNLLAHRDPEISYNDLFHIMADRALESWGRTRGVKVEREKKEVNQKGSLKENESLESQGPALKDETGEMNIETPPAGFLYSSELSSSTFRKGWRNIPARLRREVWRRDRGRCSYLSADTGRRCASQFGLEFDHIQPVSLGGLSLPSNLRLLCRNHNAHAAVKELGVGLMKKYLPSLN